MNNHYSYSPIGRGMLTSQIRSYADIPEGDIRQRLPRFQPENFAVNLKLANELEKIAKKKDCTPAQLALGWHLSLSKRQGMPVVIPIPDATTAERVKENGAAVELTDEEMQDIKGILDGCAVVGDRYHTMGMAMTNL